MQKKHFKLSLWTGLSLLLCSQSFAAVVPAGTKLAKNQVLNIDNQSEITSLDPNKSSDNLANNILFDLYEPLIVNNSEGKYVPGAATSWDVSKDGLTYTFHLRKNALWSDGKPVEAEDFAYSFRRLVDPKTAATYAFMLNMVKNANKILEGKLKPESLGVKALDKHTFQVTLDTPTPYFLGLVAIPQLVPLRKDLIEKHGDQWVQAQYLVTNGAYVLKEWKVGDKISIVRNKKYWDDKNTVIENVNFLVVTDKTASLRLYQAGQIDWTYGLPPGQSAKLKKEYPNEIHASPSLSTHYFMFNTKVPALSDVRVRKALSMTVDRNALAKHIMDKGEKAHYDLPPLGIANYSPYEPEWAKWSSEKRITEAKKLYAEAGFSEKNPLKIKYSLDVNDTSKKYATAIASMWEKSLGAKVELISSEWKVHLTNLHEKKYEVTLSLWGADFNDPYNFAVLIEGKNPQNQTNYASKRFDDLLAATNLELNLDKRKILMKEALKMALEDYPVAPIASGTSMRLIKPYVKGASFKNPMDIHLRKDLYIVSHDGNS
ncbi:peptide ABC transporter substrate-binding protein [Fluviispira vulneris]|uniref:peptide ABC transporter substrate-binding protein n=1 Tax=Fluviispira vulneris TaxID=2763012 RepID=UPI001645A346|nr:peptide ABC transporter substrate-binding protein [Fluviispira vulneris]